MSVGIGLKRCCLECSRPRLELVEIKRGIFDRDVNVYCECSDICRAYAVDEGDVVSVQNCGRDALLEEVKELEKCAWYFGLDFDADEPLRDRLKEASEDFAGCASRIREAVGA